jgi:hypothetical protein
LRGGNVLLKTFLFGILLGVAAAAGALYAVPVVDQYREVSIVSVAPNGGNRESFHINIPVDRVMVGAAGDSSGLPLGLKWPEDEILANVSTEVFKVRNAKNAVIGIAARTVAKEDDTDVIDWIIHLPARGSLFVNMEAQPRESGHRIGQLRAGSREFDDLSGFVAERWVSDTSGDEDAPIGRIELLANYVGISEPQDRGETEPLE